MVLIGDSLTNHLFNVLRDYFDYPGSPYTFTSIGLIHGTISLNPSHPLTAGILERAEVPTSRLNTPLVTWWRHHHLLSVPELEKIHKGIDLYKLKDVPKEPDWWPLFLVQRAEAYSGREGPYVEGYSDEPLVNEGEDDAEEWQAQQQQQRQQEQEQERNYKTEKDIVILNVGAHWSHGELGWGMSEENSLLGYERMVSFITDRFRHLRPSIQVYWRSVAPGHVQCEQYIEAEPERTNELSTKEPTATSYNWNLLIKMNEIVQSYLRYDPGRPSRRSSSSFFSSPSTTEYIDIWNTSIQRPDAHLNPGGDCLHFCPIGVTSDWLQHQWQSIVYDSWYRDY